MTEPQIGQCARCGENLAACVRGCRGKEIEGIMNEETKRPTRRWDVDKQGCDYERADGMYVLYTDHVTELDALRAQLADMLYRLRCSEDALQEERDRVRKIRENHEITKGKLRDAQERIRESGGHAGEL